MIAEVHIVNLLLALSIAANGIFGIIIFARNRASASNMAFFALTIAAGLWGAAMFVLRMNSDNPEIAELFARLLFVAAASIPASFLYFAFIFPRRD
ncbi:MAG: histidine kinase N-terminal 7TM domain-containing protein, partial [bacterium]|nr:histidine kinase N-terminal 7TM domain-containing protein [bacterium]